MTGTERAAMRLALGLLRDGTFGDIVTEVLWHGGWRDLVDAYDAASDSDTSPRILRARLALYLRAVLRADADDRYAVNWSWPADHHHWGGVCDKCREPVPRYYKGERIESGKCKGALVRHPRPLWYDAPRSKP